MQKLIPEWLWPRLNPLSAEDQSRQEKWILNEKKEINEASWGDKCDVALEEARRLFDAEQERRRGADSKAGLYLAAITALAPILATIFPGILDDKISQALKITLLVIFICALLYLIRAGLWALQTMKVSAIAQLSAGEIAKNFSSEKPEENLVKSLLRAVTFNYSGTNEKISCIKMTHEFLLRAFFGFAAFLAVQVAWPTAASAVVRINAEIITPIIACFP